MRMPRAGECIEAETDSQRIVRLAEERKRFDSLENRKPLGIPAGKIRAFSQRV